MRRGLVVLAADQDDLPTRPRVRSDCLAGGFNSQRPCGWLSCRHHVIDILVGEAGGIRLGGSYGISLAAKADATTIDAFDEEVADLVTSMSPSCTLDVADRGLAGTVTIAARAMHLSRARIRQIERSLLRGFRRRALRAGLKP